MKDFHPLVTHHPTPGQRPYIGRFAPSPSGPLHAGSMATALASWLDARAHGGRWLVRIEDVDAQRCHPDWVPVILRQLSRCGLEADEPVVWQSGRRAFYEAALARLSAAGHTYACDCSRSDIRAAQALVPHPPALSSPGELPYPGTCRTRGLAHQPGRAVRLRCGTHPEHPVVIEWRDQRLGPQQENVTESVGDFVLKRRDGLWAYQLAVVVDDAAQGITHVVRGEDLVSNTARQIYLQRLLGYSLPSYLHTPLVLDAERRKLSKHHGAPAVSVESTEDIRRALQDASRALGLSLPYHLCEQGSPSELLSHLIVAWKQPAIVQ